MTRDEISTLAEAAGLNYSVDLQYDGRHHICLDGWPENFERFAQLVAARERDECEKVCASLSYGVDCLEAIRNRGSA
jgi:hypothetical protein